MLPCFGKMGQLDYFEQLFPVGGGVHGYEYVRQAVYDFHVAARRYPYQGWAVSFRPNKKVEKQLQHPLKSNS